jgi:predicted acetyltransferase
LIDDLLPWNADRWETRIERGDVETVPLASGEPELSMTVNTLAMLIFGQITATEAARAGRIGVYDAAALRRWDDALRTRYAPFCSDHF